MIPSVLANQIRNYVEDFISTTFHPTNSPFKNLIGDFLHPPIIREREGESGEESGVYQPGNNVCKGPYVSLGMPFKTGSIGRDFFPHIPLDFIPYLHQQEAFTRLMPPHYHSTLIATGTGSGKTECFLIPVLEHCRIYSQEGGIKAILIYPMNALATDQAKRIAKFINSIPSLKGKVTAGLYVGEEDENPTKVMTKEKVITDKQTLLASPPDILLTNYKMLDYL
ncbi:DEAD/DEAH box helicase, partial [Cylindrospermopsis raciborskii CS-506_D]